MRLSCSSSNWAPFWLSSSLMGICICVSIRFPWIFRSNIGRLEGLSSLLESWGASVWCTCRGVRWARTAELLRRISRWTTSRTWALLGWKWYRWDIKTMLDHRLSHNSAKPETVGMIIRLTDFAQEKLCFSLLKTWNWTFELHWVINSQCFLYSLSVNLVSCKNR